MSIKSRVVGRIVGNGKVKTVVLDPSGTTRADDNTIVQARIADPMVRECLRLGGVAIRYKQEIKPEQALIHIRPDQIVPIGNAPAIPDTAKWTIVRLDFPTEITILPTDKASLPRREHDRPTTSLEQQTLL